MTLERIERDDRMRAIYLRVDEDLTTSTAVQAADPAFIEWLTRQRIRHTDLYQTFMALSTSEVTQDHFVETVVEAALTYGFRAGAMFIAEVQQRETT